MLNGKRHPVTWEILTLAAAVSALALSCDMSSSGLLTETERSSLYTLTVDLKNGSALADGAVVYPGAEIAAFVAKKSGAGDLAALDFSLVPLSASAVSGASSTAALRFVASTGKAVSSQTALIKRVASIEGKLEGFTIPETAASGAYTLSVSVSGSDGSSLQQEKLYVFIGKEEPVIDSVSVFPPSVEPGASVLLGLTTSWRSVARAALVDAAVSAANLATNSAVAATAVDASTETLDPWIRWSKDGVSFSEGLLSSGFGKVVWTAPSAEGAYSIAAEVFPSAPASGSTFAFKAAARQELKVMVIAASGGSGNDFADALSFYSLLKLEGSFEDSGTRPRNDQPKSFGSPSLDTYDSGFGYRFDDSAGVKIAGLMPPSSSGKLGAFAVLIRLNSSESDGSLVSFASSDGSYIVAFGLKGGKPYAETRVGGKTQRSVAVSAVSPSPFTLEAVVTPNGEKIDIAWRIEGELVEAPSLDLVAAPPAGSATLGGPGSLSGVYDGFGLMVAGSSSSYPSPTYRLASRRKWKSSLILAESFENGVLPDKSSSSGKVAPSIAGLVLSPSSSLILAPAFGVGAGLVVEADISGDPPTSLLVFSLPEGGRAFAVRATGEILDASGASIGSVTVSDAKLSLSIEQSDGVARIAGGGKAFDLPCSAKKLALSLEREKGSGNVVVGKVLVRSVSAKP
jgi:hypothetical protein